jgi:hypothetical protein
MAQGTWREGKALQGRLPTELSSLLSARYSSPMATTTPRKYRCMQCEMTEERCDCEKYCCLCQSLVEVRLCEDGLYYCKPCREACNYKVSESASTSNF